MKEANPSFNHKSVHQEGVTKLPMYKNVIIIVVRNTKAKRKLFNSVSMEHNHAKTDDISAKGR